MEHLHSIYEQKGVDFFEQLLSDVITINIKVDQSAFVLRKQSGLISFHGRDGQGTIDKIKRAGMDTYEHGIAHIESQTLCDIPDDVEVFMEIFSDQWKTAVQYKTKPKNNLIVSFVVQGGRTVLPNEPLIDDIVSVLDIAPPPILFSGTLSYSQKTSIREFVSANQELRQQRYGGSNFVTFINSIFVTPAHLMWLQECGYEGLVFYFKNSHCCAKLVDPSFSLDKREERAQPISQFKRTMLDIIFDHLSYAVEQTFIQCEFTTPSDDTYIEFISYLTEYFVQKYAVEFRALDVFDQEQKNSRWSNISASMVPEFVVKLIEQHWWAEELFTFLLFGLRKEKKAINTRQCITRERKDLINEIVGQLRMGRVLK